MNGAPRTAPLLLAALGLALFGRPPAARPQTPEHFDVLIRGAHVLDGTGNPWFYADVAVRDGKIARVDRLRREATADRVIDASGLTVIPGIVDLHSHAWNFTRPDPDPDPEARQRWAAPNLVSQGITTVVTGIDGRSGWPIREWRASIRGAIGMNTISLVGHHTIRNMVLGENYERKATPAEIEKMRALVRQGMAEGAWGLSANLEHTVESGRFSDTDEMVALVSEIVPYGGIFSEHERGSGLSPTWYLPSRYPPGPVGILGSVEESIEISERTGATVVMSHMKVRGANFWGAGRAVINLIERARDRGVNVWSEQYAYPTTHSDGVMLLIPEWVKGETTKTALRQVLADPKKAADLRMDIAYEIERRGGAENILILDYPDQAYVGKTLLEVARMRGVTPVEMGIILTQEGYEKPANTRGFDREGGAVLRGFSISEIDIELFAPQPWMGTASDAGPSLPSDGLEHPRSYGVFPHMIRRYALERKVVTVPHAVRSMTSLPAQILGLRDRGMVREGYAADLALIDLKTIRERSTYFEPHQYPDGIPYVMVNGVLVVDGGAFTWELPGQLLSPDKDGPGRPGRQASEGRGR